MSTMVTKEVKMMKVSQDGLVQTICWQKKADSYQGVIVLCHGMAEHIERYQRFAETLANEGYVVFGYSHRGHKGTAETIDEFGYAGEGNQFDLLVSDLYEVIMFLKKEYPTLPFFLFGHSMGSFISMRFAQLYDVELNGLILSGSARVPKAKYEMGIFLARLITRFKGRKHRSKLLNKLSFDAYNKVFRPNRTSFDWLNRDNREVDNYVNDEWCGGIVTSSFYRDFLLGLRAINKNYELISKKLPVFIISGSKDPVGGLGKYVLRLHKTLQKLQMLDLTCKLYDGARHEILLETNQLEIFSDIKNWITNHR